MRNFLAYFLIFLGFSLLTLSIYFFWRRYNPNRLAFKNIDEGFFATSNLTPKSAPLWLFIEELDINLPVIPAKYEKKRWETTTKGVSYLTSSATPGDVGNSIFYGHNFKNILGNLKNAKPGQIIRVGMEDRTWRNFRIEYVQVVDSDQVGILDQTSDKRLTLYTCTGFLDSKRLVVTALFQEGQGDSI